MGLINKYVNTVEAGAGSYPEPPEPTKKCYMVDFNATIKGYGIVYAKNEEEARDLASQNDFDDIIETFDMEIEEVTDIKED